MSEKIRCPEEDNELNSKTGIKLYNSITVLGISAPSTINEVYSKLPVNSVLFDSADNFSDAATRGIVQIIKYASARSAIFLYAKNEYADCRMFLDAEGNPTNEWLKVKYTEL